MLKRIAPNEAELGMFIHKLEGSWFKHPFWRSKFLLDDAGMLEDLRDSDVPSLLIDTSRGIDRAPSAPHSTLVSATPAEASPPARRKIFARAAPEPFDFASTQRTTMAREFGHAQLIARRGERAVSRVFLNARLGKAVDAEQVSPVISDIFASVQRNPHALNGLMRCKRDNQFVYQHALAVSALMIALAKTLKLTPVEVREAGMAGLLLDVGIGLLQVDMERVGGDWREIPEEVLHSHTTLGHDFLRTGGGIPEAVARVALEHHERVDGHGYPRKLAGDAISRLGRMAAICDTYDVLVTDRAHARGLDPATAIVAMRRMDGRFDTVIFEAFAESIGAFPVGAVVELQSARLAMVVDQDLSDHRLPKVRTFWSIGQNRAIAPEEIALARCFGEDRIVGPADPQAHGVENWAQLRLKIFTAACKGAG